VRRTTVEVGKDGKLEFEPNNIDEPVGTIIDFIFHPKNHTVTQADFKAPCQPSDKGFSSGFIPVAASPSGVKFEYTVSQESPVFFYCGQGNHCQSGMVGSLNA
jgi:plastocyanin